jgi:DNA-directed RNA polymerase specialized sigma24 family protein
MRVEEEPPRGEETVVREPRALSPAGRAFLHRNLPRLASSQRVAFVLREGLALSWTTIAFVLDKRETPSARLLHYRAVLRLKELATTKREARLVAALGA